MSRTDTRAVLIALLLVITGFVIALVVFLPTEPGLNIDRILLSIRLPEALTALLVGGSLGISGLLFQLLLRNDLADPYILGVAGGGTFSAVIVILLAGEASFFIGFPVRTVAAFSGGFATLFLLMKLSRGRPVVLLLGGVVANTAFAAASRLITVLFSPSQLARVTAYLVGFVPTPPLWVPLAMSIPVLYCLVRFWLFGRGLDLLLLSDEEASSLGLAVRKIRGEALILATLLACMAVSVCGMIGFVGLVVPHISKLIAGHHHKVLVIVSFLVGGAFLLFAQGAGKVFAGTLLLPVGVYTSLVGAPVFLILLVKSARRGWS